MQLQILDLALTNQFPSSSECWVGVYLGGRDFSVWNYLVTMGLQVYSNRSITKKTNPTSSIIPFCTCWIYFVGFHETLERWCLETSTSFKPQHGCVWPMMFFLVILSFKVMCFMSAFAKVITIFVLIVSIILVNLLVAQLNQAYQHVYTDMQGSDGREKRTWRMMEVYTPPKFNGESPEKRYLKKERIVSQASFFRGDLLKFRGVYTYTFFLPLKMIHLVSLLEMYGPFLSPCSSL